MSYSLNLRFNCGFNITELVRICFFIQKCVETFRSRVSSSFTL